MGMANEMRKNPVRVGMYDVEKTIGKGNFAVVKLARHRITKSQVRVNTSPWSTLTTRQFENGLRFFPNSMRLRESHVLSRGHLMTFFCCDFAAGSDKNHRQDVTR